MRCFILLIAAGALWAQAPGRLSPTQRYELFQKHLAMRGAAITHDPLRGATSLDEWKKQRPELQRQLRDMLGLDPLPPRTPLNVRITGSFDRPGHRVENIVFESKPKLYVTGNLYLPAAAGPSNRATAIVYVSGPRRCDRTATMAAAPRMPAHGRSYEGHSASNSTAIQRSLMVHSVPPL